jgi:hypothetical protein
MIHLIIYLYTPDSTHYSCHLQKHILPNIEESHTSMHNSLNSTLPNICQLFAFQNVMAQNLSMLCKRGDVLYC